jgi:uncharacterized protein YkwD
MTRIADRHPLVHLLGLLVAALAALLAAGALVPARAHAGGYDWLLAPTTQCGGHNQVDRSLSATDQEKVMQCLHNWARRRAGVGVLRPSSLLYNSSGGKTADMMRCHQFSHTACGHYMQYHFDRVGYTSGVCWGWGENIAWGPTNWGSPRAIMRSWLNSTVHRENILNRSFRDFGVGVRKGTFMGHRDSEVWTAHFGYRC